MSDREGAALLRFSAAAATIAALSFWPGFVRAQGAPATTQAKPVIERSTRVGDRNDSDVSLGNLLARSDVVLEVVVTGGRPTDYVTDDWTFVFTTFDCTVLAVYKDPSRRVALGQNIGVRRNGGDRDRGDHIERNVAPNEFVFRSGEHYILFLRRREWAPGSEHSGVYYEESFTGLGTLRIGASGIEAIAPRWRLGQELQGTPVEAFRSRLRSALAG